MAGGLTLISSLALCEDCETLPVNFKNTRSHMMGLTEGEAYKVE